MVVEDKDEMILIHSRRATSTSATQDTRISELISTIWNEQCNQQKKSEERPEQDLLIKTSKLKQKDKLHV
jgi:hypothetical protein